MGQGELELHQIIPPALISTPVLVKIGIIFNCFPMEIRHVMLLYKYIWSNKVS